MKVTQEANERPIKNWAINIEERAFQQARNIASLPFIASNGVALMPDAHAGYGSTVGSVIATERAIIPAAVGVDIGCGMNAVRTSLTAEDLPDGLNILRASIERGIPMGAGGYRIPQDKLPESLHDIPESVATVFRAKDKDRGDYDINKVRQKAGQQLGTLGSGNHFIELCLDEAGRVWIMLHSGSRGLGNKIGMHYISIAKREMERFHITLPDVDLAYLPEGSENFNEYIEAMHWAQNFAMLNREEMMRVVIRQLSHFIKRPFTLDALAINCHHNYTEKEHHGSKDIWVTRKGAIRARQGDLGIIPGSMGAKSFIVRGLGNPESYHSCSHGAGRVMSRTEAKRRFTVDDLVAQTEGIECRKDDGVLDEIPGAYKDIDEVMAAQSDLVEIVHTLRAVMCVKGG